MTKKLIPRFLVSLSICLILLSALFSSQKLLQLVISGVKASADTVTNPTITIDANHFLDYFNLNGNATYSGNILTLTAAARGQVGTASMKQNFDPTQDWTLTGELNIGILKTIANTNGADGVGFGWVPDNIGNVGGTGDQLGIGKLKGAFGWAADTYLNDYRTNDIYNWSDKKYSTSGYVGTQTINGTSGYLFYGDPNGGATGTSNWAKGGFGFANPAYNNLYTSYNTSSINISSKPQSISSLEDGQFHTYTMSYQASTGLVTVTFGTLTWSIPFITIMAAAGSDTSNAISFFISGSTGAQYNLQQFKFTSLTYTTAPIKSSLTVNYIDINGSPISPPVNITGNVGDNYTTNPLSTPPANMHFNNFNSTDTNTIFNATTNIGTGKILKSGTVVNYVYAPNKVKINYIDDTTSTNLLTDTPDYYSNPNYTTASKIANYLGQGYKLVSDNTPTTNLFVSDGAVYNVHLIHNYAGIVKTVSESINYVDNSTNTNMLSITPNPYTATITFLTVTDQVTNTQTYYYQNGTITAIPTISSIGIVNDTKWTSVKQSGGYWTDSSSNKISFNQVIDPTSKGYIIVGTDDPNKTTTSQVQLVMAQPISTALVNIKVNVLYDPTKVVATTYTINRKINYLDINDHSIVVAKQAQQIATFTAYQVIDLVTKGVLGYDTNGDGSVDSQSAVWVPSTANSTNNSVINSPDLTSKGYGPPSQVTVSSFTDVPNLTDNSKIIGQPINSSLSDTNVYYNVKSNLIKLPFTGGIGFVWIIVLAVVSFALAFMIRKKKDK